MIKAKVQGRCNGRIEIGLKSGEPNSTVQREADLIATTLFWTLPDITLVHLIEALKCKITNRIVQDRIDNLKSEGKDAVVFHRTDGSFTVVPGDEIDEYLDSETVPETSGIFSRLDEENEEEDD